MKLGATADVAQKYLGAPETSNYLREAVTRVARCRSITTLTREIEGEAAAVYFTAWRNIKANFDTDKIPTHWTQFGTRNSLNGNRRTARQATNPINALLNYLYTVAASECRLACIAVGLVAIHVVGPGLWAAR